MWQNALRLPPILPLVAKGIKSYLCTVEQVLSEPRTPSEINRVTARKLALFHPVRDYITIKSLI